MPNTRDIHPQYVKCLLYGPTGAGKTFFFKSARQVGKVYVLDFDGGMLSLRGSDIEYDTYQDLIRNGVMAKSAIVDALRKVDELEKQLSKGKCPYQVIGFDSLTLLEGYWIAKLTSDQGNQVAGFNEYKMMTAKYKEFFARITKWPCHVIFTAHDQMLKDENTGEVHVLPLLMGKMAHKTPLYFDEVYYLNAEEVKGETVRTLLTTKSGKYTAKSRLAGDLGVIQRKEVADFSQLLNKVNCEKRRVNGMD